MKQIMLKKPLPPHIRFHKNAWNTDGKKKNTILMHPPASWKKIYSKAYPRLKHVVLPAPKLPPESLRNTLSRRSSHRTFTKKAITPTGLSSLLYYSCGIKNGNYSRRFYPSAGGRYPLEVYITPLQGDLRYKMYHYYPHEHILENIGNADAETLMRIYGNEWSWISKSGVLICITAVFKRTTHKYGEKGYQFALLEAGHMGQNMYLVSEALGLGCCALGGYDNKKADAMLDIDGIRETVIYMLAVGRGLT